MLGDTIDKVIKKSFSAPSGVHNLLFYKAYSSVTYQPTWLFTPEMYNVPSSKSAEKLFHHVFEQGELRSYQVACVIGHVSMQHQLCSTELTYPLTSIETFVNTICILYNIYD